MKSKNLVADEVGSGLNVGRDSRFPLESLQNDTIAPLAPPDVARKQTGLINLEPVSAAIVGAAAVARALGEPDSDGSLGVSPLSPDGSNLGASSNFTVELGGLAVVVAANGVRGWVVDGVVAAPWSLDGRLAGGRIVGRMSEQRVR